MKYENKTDTPNRRFSEVGVERQRDTENPDNLETIGYLNANADRNKHTEKPDFVEFIRDPWGLKSERHTNFWALFWALLIVAGVMFATSLIGPKDCRPGSLRDLFTNCG